MSNQPLLSQSPMAISDDDFSFPTPDQIRNQRMRHSVRYVENQIAAAMRIDKNWVKIEIRKLPRDSYVFLQALETKSYRVGISTNRRFVVIEW